MISWETEIVRLEIMDGFEFEKFCGRLFEKLNYGIIETTQSTGDMGRDILIYSDEGLIVVECKHQPYSTIGRPIVQKLHSATISSNAMKGILITTGKFSLQAIKHAKELDPPIELIDRKLLSNLALQANIEIFFEGECDIIFTYPNPDFEKLCLKIKEKLDSEIISFPRKPSEIIAIEKSTLSIHPYYSIQYNVNSIFKTSIGIIHEEIVEDEIIQIDGQDGKCLNERISIHMKTVKPQKYNNLEFERIEKIKNYQVDSSTLNRLAKKYISNRHSKNISYYGRNNQKYNKLCTPHNQDISITDTKQIYLSCQKIIINSYKHKYIIQAIENSQEFLCYTNIFNCAICGRYIKGKKVLCNSCGAITHKSKSHSSICRICGKTLCKDCTYMIKSNKKFQCLIEILLGISGYLIFSMIFNDFLNTWILISLILYFMYIILKQNIKVCKNCALDTGQNINLPNVKTNQNKSDVKDSHPSYEII